MLSRLILNLVQALGFGLRVKMNGKPYISLLRYDERNFLAIEDGKPMPSPVYFIQADLAVEDQPPAPDQEKKEQPEQETPVVPGSETVQ